jgi:HEPN domain-containing protein
MVRQGPAGLGHGQSCNRRRSSSAGQCCYHAQQCAEKYLKGFLKSRQATFKWIHDLNYLLELCCEFDAAFSALADDADALTHAAEPSRYPSSDEVPVTREEALEAMQIADRIRSCVRTRMGS